MGDGQLHTTINLPWVPWTTMLEIQGPKACPKARDQEQVFLSHCASSHPSHPRLLTGNQGRTPGVCQSQVMEAGDQCRWE